MCNIDLVNISIDTFKKGNFLYPSETKIELLFRKVWQNFYYI